MHVMNTVRRVLAGLPLPLLSLVAACDGSSGDGGPFQPVPNVHIAFERNNFRGDPITHSYFPLTPGTRFIYEGVTEAGSEHIEFEVTYETKTLLGVECVEVHDTAYVDGDLVEDTLDWFAQDVNGNVWYFGEFSETIEDGEVVSTQGSWEGGVDDAVPGIVMLASPQVGRVYAQEYAPPDALDRGEIVSLGASETVPYGSFTNCIHTEEFTPVEPDVIENKFYARGVGQILELDENDDRIELTTIEYF